MSYASSLAFLSSSLVVEVIIIIIIIIPCEFFTPGYSGSLWLESDWQQVSLDLQDSSQYSGRPHQCYSLDGLLSSSILLLLLLLEFFTSALADGLSLWFEWHEVSLNLQDSSQYSGWSKKCNSLDGLHSTFYFHVHYYYYYYYYYYYVTSREFLTPALAGGLSLEPQWQQASSSLQDSSQYSSLY